MVAVLLQGINNSQVTQCGEEENVNSISEVRFEYFFSSVEQKVSVYICLWAVTFSPRILNSNILPFPP